MTPSSRACIFDLDGTMIDSAPGIFRSLRFAFDKMNRQIPDEPILRKFLGPPLAASFIQFCGFTKEEAIQAVEYYRENYSITGWKESRVYPGIRRLLYDLKMQGYFLGVATGKPQESAEQVLRYYGLAHLFDSIVGPKPHQHFANKEDLLREALAGFDGQAVMIGDRDTDILAATALGAQGIAALYGYGNLEEFQGTGVTHLADSVDGLRLALQVAHCERTGLFVSFEGNDGSGKSTQVQHLYEFLTRADYSVIKTREPGGSVIAEKIRELVLDRENTGMQDLTEAYLYAAARAQHVRDILLPALQDGQIVLCDRFVDSSVAYQGAGRELGTELIKQINAPAVKGCMPDLTILLELPADKALRRRTKASQADRIEMQDMAFHARVQQAFRLLAEQETQRIKAIDASVTVCSLAETIRSMVSNELEGTEVG